MKIVITKDTVVKPSTQPAASLQSNQLQIAPRNLVFLVEDSLVDSHYQLKGKELYVFKDHCSVLESPKETWLETATKFIAGFEGFRSYAYYLPGEPTWTIGYGTTRINGVAVKSGDTITQVNALKLFEDQVVEFGNQVKTNLPNWGKLTDNQKAAMVSFAYNIGIVGFISSSARQDVIQGRDPSKNLSLWNKGSHKQVMLGLVNRRKAESDLYNS